MKSFKEIKKMMKTDAKFLKELCQLSRLHDSYRRERAEEIVQFALNVRTREKILRGAEKSSHLEY